MPYRGNPKAIKIPEDVYYRFMAVKGKTSNRKALESMISLVEMVGKMLNTKRIDAVTVEKAFKKLAEEEGLI